MIIPSDGYEGGIGGEGEGAGGSGSTGRVKYISSLQHNASD
jgi:hypothetical protein